jgi:hypothetical protein
MALKGDLRDFPITSLFNLVNLANKTGMLVLQSHNRSANVYFRDGKLIQAVIGSQPEDLASLLLRGGRITTEQAGFIRQRARTQTDKELGLLLIGAGYCSQRDVVQAVKAHILGNVYPLFTWNEGSFYFEANIVPPEDQVTITLNLENIIIEGTRCIKEWERLKDDLPNLDVALMFVAKPTTNMKEVQLSVEEWRVLSYVNPKNPIRQIAKACGMDEFQIRKTVYRLLQAGLVQIVKPAIKTTPAPAHAAATSREQRLNMPPPPKIDRGLVGRLISKIRSIGV